MQQALDQLAREDLVMFVNAGLSCTGQAEFYSSAADQASSYRFLHDYVLGNYRRLYTQSLCLGINDHCRARIIFNLLTSRAALCREQLQEEGALIARSLCQMPPQRVFRLFAELCECGLNNRRTRRIVRDYLDTDERLNLHLVKYRRHLQKISRHFHLRWDEEQSALLHDWRRIPHYNEPLFESFRKAHYCDEGVYELPFSVAEGFASRRKIPRDRFLSRIAPTLTVTERSRLQRSGAKVAAISMDLGRLPLTRLATYILGLPLEERRQQRARLDAAMRRATQRCLQTRPLALGRVHAVLDNSASTGGSRAKRRRPLAVALAASYLLEAASESYRESWISPVEDPLFVRPRGSTRLGPALLDALEGGAETVVIVSDAVENDPPGATRELLRCFRASLDPQAKTQFIHLNPTFDAETFAPAELSPIVATMGVRDAEDLPAQMQLARFATGRMRLRDLHRFLDRRVVDFLGRHP